MSPDFPAPGQIFRFSAQTCLRFRVSVAYGQREENPPADGQNDENTQNKGTDKLVTEDTIVWDKLTYDEMQATVGDDVVHSTYSAGNGQTTMVVGSDGTLFIKQESGTGFTIEAFKPGEKERTGFFGPDGNPIMPNPEGGYDPASARLVHVFLNEIKGVDEDFNPHDNEKKTTYTRLKGPSKPTPDEKVTDWGENGKQPLPDGPTETRRTDPANAPIDPVPPATG